MQNWIVDNKDSVAAFEAIRHTILPSLVSGEVHSIEMVDNDILLMMDRHSGIDLIRVNEKGLQGVAWRAQWGRAFDTFTIRTKRHTGNRTELEKRLKAIEDGYFYPAYTIQAYFNNRVEHKCLSIAVVETRTLYRLYIDKPVLFVKRQSDNEFAFIKWEDIPVRIKTWRLQKHNKQLGFFEH